MVWLTGPPLFFCSNSAISMKERANESEGQKKSDLVSANTNTNTKIYVAYVGYY